LDILNKEQFDSDIIESKINQSYSYGRIVGLLVIAFILLSILASRLWYLQVFRYSYYKQRSEDNRLRIIPIPPSRGVISDRNGNVLATNRTSYSLLLYPTKITPEIEKKFENLSKIIDVPKEEILAKINSLGSNSPYPVNIVQDLDQNMISRLLEDRFSFPPLTIEPDLIRLYTKKHSASHILGYTGEITQDELDENKDSKETNYKMGDIIGKTGVESTFEKYLKGEKGGHFIEVDSIGRKIKTLKTDLPKRGNSIKLTIDMNIQRKLEGLLEGKSCAGVVMDVNTGEIIAMASKPDFDPNMFSSGISKKEWAKVQQLQYPFLNRAINPYTPGSIFKIITSSAGLELGKTSEYRQFYSKGFFKIGNHTFWDWNPTGFGWVNMEKALAYSIDTVYYELATEMSMNDIKRYANLYSLGQKTGIDLPAEAKGLIPSRAWKIKYWGEDWYGGDTINSSIGQGFIQVSPLQAAVMTAALANGGKVLKPIIVKSIENKETQKPIVKRNLNMSTNNLRIIKEGLRGAVTYGTAGLLKFSTLQVAAKTGSAEDPPRRKTHAWVVSYAPYNNPKYTVVIFLQNYGHGGGVAAPIAREIYKELYKIK